MTDRDVVGAELIARKPGISRSTARRIDKKGELKVFKQGENSSPLRRRESDIEAFKRKKRARMLNVVDMPYAVASRSLIKKLIQIGFFANPKRMTSKKLARRKRFCASAHDALSLRKNNASPRNH